MSIGECIGKLKEISANSDDENIRDTIRKAIGYLLIQPVTISNIKAAISLLEGIPGMKYIIEELWKILRRMQERENPPEIPNDERGM